MKKAADSAYRVLNLLILPVQLRRLILIQEILPQKQHLLRKLDPARHRQHRYDPLKPQSRYKIQDFHRKHPV